MTTQMRGPQRLTIAMIVKDAPQLVAETIASVRNIADEIVIVDTGSSEQNRDKIRRLATKLVDFKWCDDFAAARNAALAHITGDWVLWLDTAEIVTAADAIAIRNFLDQGAKPNTGYLLAIEVPSKRDDSSGEQVTRLRLLPTRKDIRFAGRVHEQVQYDEPIGPISVELGPAAIQRTMREHDTNYRCQRAERNLRIANLEAAANGPSPRTEIIRGEAFIELQQIGEAVTAFQNAIKDAPRGSTEQLEAFYGWLTAYDQFPELREEQIAIAASALDIFPLDAQLLCAVGGYMQQQGRSDLAARSYQMAAEHGQVNVETWHLPNIAEVATTCWAMSLEMNGKYDQALELMEKVASCETPTTSVLRHLMDMYVVRDQRQNALELIRHIQKDISKQDAMRTAVRGACMAAKQNWSGAMQYLQNAYDAGLRDPICMRWLAMCCLSLGDRAKAASIAKEWNQLDPESTECMRIINLCEGSASPNIAAMNIFAPTLAPATPITTKPQPAAPFSDNNAGRQARFDTTQPIKQSSLAALGLPNATLAEMNMD